MQLRETQYLGVKSGSNTNYYRIRVYAKTVLGESDFRAGWYPAAAVDALFGDVSAEGSTAALKTEDDIRRGIDAALKEALTEYLNKAKDPKATAGELTERLTALKAVRAAPGENIPLPRGAKEIEYNPTENLILRHAGQKLVFVLSSNPDEVIGAISNFAEQQKTGIGVLRLAETIQRASEQQTIKHEARNEVAAHEDATLHQELIATREFIDPDSASGAPKPEEVRARLESLLSLIQQQGAPR